MSRAAVLIEAGRLAAAGEAFVLVTVVHVIRPASTHNGDRAIVTADGRFMGWVGGACSEPVVIREALRALADREPRRIRIGPSGQKVEGPTDAVVAHSCCASEGVMEILLEPELPTPLLAVIGEGPAAKTLAEITTAVGWRTEGVLSGNADAVVVATMGHRDEEVLAQALTTTSAGYVGLVASHRRARAVLSQLRERGFDEQALARIKSPAGLDLGHCSQEEIAVAVLAELVARRYGRADASGSADAEIDSAVRPLPTTTSMS